ncbi:nucleotidyltransferase family protein [Cohaesibacter gelatinilyticus]|uniref:Nucleotidyl transferase n=1 Tax=Cohaesibacter gelatinilyticus TaxID=372072 RepID=A0A285PFA7_9HYPH|nr:nucleotidyltransferase family protein [Cohaesibacter gelatinilyticus]SNZ20128.1 Nucleotidyl transferase [Cohaesibacter gelatinilyticus]
MTPLTTNKDWQKALLPMNATLQQAIHCLNDSAFQIAIVIHADGKLRGTLTDGDIRRGLLRGMTLESSIESLVKLDPFVVPTSFGRDAVLMLMQSNGVQQLPIVDENRMVVGLHALDELLTPQTRENLMVVMAGGQGRRLRPHTENCPKPLIPVAGKPMLEHIIERARSEGFGKFILAIHYLGHMIEEYFGNGAKWGVEISYLREDRPLGTAGAIGLMADLPEQPFVVSNGDVLTDIRYGELLDFHNRHGAMATMAVRLHEWQHPFGVVRTKGVDIVGFEEKPISRSHINAGVYVLDPLSLQHMQKGEHSDMPSLFARLQGASQRTIVYPMHEPWLDVGRPDDLQTANSQKS